MADISNEFFLNEINKRFGRICEHYAAGEDVASGERLRLEGFIQAGLVLNIVQFDDVVGVLDRVSQHVFSEPFGEVFPPYSDVDCVIAIPAKMHRAPVFQTTKD
jgi:hypothetical protein